MEVMHSTPQECVQNHTLEQIGDVLPLTPQERAQNRTRDQNVDVPVPQFNEVASFWRCHGARTSHGGASASDC